MKHRIWLSLIATALLTTGAYSQKNVHHSDVHFSYDGDTGPAYWYSLKDEWETCKNGLTLKPVKAGEPHQSPVDFRNAKAVMPDFDLNYDKNLDFKIINNGHSIMFKAVDQKGASVHIDGKTYYLKQFHFHYLSEHTIKGKHTPMEVHFVNISDDGSIAVLGVFIDSTKGQGNSMLEKAFSVSLPPSGYANVPSIILNPAKMLPGGKVYSYSGSLTTPPCSENVKWNVYVKHNKLSKQKINAFKKHYDHNYRPVTGSY
jgi:carbonic anhydrase